LRADAGLTEESEDVEMARESSALPWPNSKAIGGGGGGGGGDSDSAARSCACTPFSCELRAA